MANTFITIAEVDKTRPKRVGVKLSDGSWMGCFDSKLWPRLEVGANLNVTVEESERDGRTYRNITGILGTAASPNGSVTARQKERNIIRESALRAACELYHGYITQQTDHELDWVLHTADRFAAWIEEKEADEAPF